MRSILILDWYHKHEQVVPRCRIQIGTVYAKAVVLIFVFVHCIVILRSSDSKN